MCDENSWNGTQRHGLHFQGIGSSASNFGGRSVRSSRAISLRRLRRRLPGFPPRGAERMHAASPTLSGRDRDAGSFWDCADGLGLWKSVHEWLSSASVSGAALTASRVNVSN